MGLGFTEPKSKCKSKIAKHILLKLQEISAITKRTILKRRSAPKATQWKKNIKALHWRSLKLKLSQNCYVIEEHCVTYLKNGCNNLGKKSTHCIRQTCTNQFFVRQQKIHKKNSSATVRLNTYSLYYQIL